MRSLLVAMLVVSACGGRTAKTTLPTQSPPVAPARDLADARSAVPTIPTDAHLVAKDPRIVDLDIIRITANSRGVGGEPEMDHVATADLFKQATEAAKGGEPERAINIYRRLVTEFPDSQYAPVALFNIAAIYDARGDLDTTIATLRELVKAYPNARESIDGHLYIAALQTDHDKFSDALVTLDEVLPRPNLSYADRIEAFARKGYVLIELHRYDDAEAALGSAVGEWKKVTKLDDPYYIAMAHYYRGELAHRKFTEAPARLPDDVLVADLEKKRVLAVAAYDRWKEALGFKQAYWATASGYQMSQIFVELWEAHVKAPYPKRIDAATRQTYVVEVHERVKEHLDKALEGHRMNVELAKAYGVETVWSKASAKKAAEVMELLAREGAGQYVTPD
ncbi:MAG TPA: tetratricopeptide repeat protein [Kofleriaceae bacterium]|nr:tetratricopeptide repeat protein [Kofleriaceae bacterium]